jgi:hypothetical protein
MPPGLPLRKRISGFVILVGVAIFYPVTKAGWDWLLVLANPPPCPHGVVGGVVGGRIESALRA